MVKKMSPIERSKVLGMLEAGLSIGEVHWRTGRAKSSIHQLKLKSEREESAKAVRNSPGQGRKCLASLGDVRKMIKLVKQSPFITAKKVKEKMRATGTKFTPRYIRKVLQRAV